MYPGGGGGMPGPNIMYGGMGRGMPLGREENEPDFLDLEPGYIIRGGPPGPGGPGGPCGPGKPRGGPGGP